MNSFATFDIVLAATLSIKGYKLLKIELEGKRGSFVFESVPESLILEFDTRNVLVEPQAFNAMIRSLTTAVKRMTS